MNDAEPAASAGSPVVESSSAPATALDPVGNDEATPAVSWRRRARISTVVLTVVFVGTFMLWLWVRPEPPPRLYQVPVVPVATTAPPTTRRSPPSTAPSTTAPRSTSTAPGTAPSTTVAPPGSSSATSTPSTTATSPDSTAPTSTLTS